MSVMTPDQTLFESEYCGRCGGSGKYSFNLMHGDRCYGCGGSGVKLTKRGKAASAYLQESLKRLASEVQVGDNVMEMVGMGGPDRWHLVEAIRNVNGELYMDLRRGSHKITRVTGPDFLVRCVRNAEELKAAKERAKAYQSTLNKLGKPLKRAAAAV